MSEAKNNKELVASGHDFARLMSSDTPIIDMAKMVTQLAERLDCTTIALREKAKQCDTLAADNVARADIIGRLVWQYSASGIRPVKNSLNPASALLHDALEVLRHQATAAAVSELKAQGVECATVHIKQNIQHLPKNDRMAYHDAIELCFGAAAQLRAGEVNNV